MSENQLAEGPASALDLVRPLSVRITDGMRAQIEVIAQLNDRSVAEEIRLALEAYAEPSKSGPKLLRRAETVRAEIEREAKAKRSAIQAVIGSARPRGARTTKQAPS